MSAYRMPCHQHPPILGPHEEPVPGVFVGALRLAETLVGHRLTAQENDPADAGTSNRVLAPWEGN